MVEERLGAFARVCGDMERMIGRVALVSGAGGDFLSQSAETGADVFLTGECKHHQALYASAAGLCVIEAGHYETERVVLLPLIKRLQELAPGVQYNLTRREEPCLRRL
jgi:putative NIF3 family GTP cyclohydrolase 1 type 2